MPSSRRFIWKNAAWSENWKKPSPGGHVFQVRFSNLIAWTSRWMGLAFLWAFGRVFPALPLWCRTFTPLGGFRYFDFTSLGKMGLMWFFFQEDFSSIQPGHCPFWEAGLQRPYGHWCSQRIDHWEAGWLFARRVCNYWWLGSPGSKGFKIGFGVQDQEWQKWHWEMQWIGRSGRNTFINKHREKQND